MATEKKSFLLRVDPALWAQLERLAATELRSVNAQVEYLLRESLAKRGVTQSHIQTSQANQMSQPEE